MLGASLAAALMVLAAACGGGTAALTLDEYAEWCGMGLVNDDLPDLDSTTWDEATAVLERLLGEATAINPPDEVREYHDGLIAAIQALVAVAREEDQDAAYSPFALFGVLLIVGGIFEEAERSLSASTRAALEAGDCLNSEDADDTSTNDSGGQVDRSEIVTIGDRITVERSQSEDRFEMVVRSRPQRAGDSYRVRVTVFAVIDEWSYDTSIWTADQIELVSAPDENGRIYKLTETTSFWDRPDDSLEGVILKVGGRHDGALYFSGGDAPPGTQFVELRYPAGGITRVVDLSR